jgi:hypothetical protein
MVQCAENEQENQREKKREKQRQPIAEQPLDTDDKERPNRVEFLL